MWIPQTIWKGTSAHQANIHQMLYGGGFRGNPAPPPSPFEIHIHVYFFHYEMLQFYFRNTDTNSLLFFMLHIFWKQTPGLGLKWLHVRVSLIRFDLNSEQHYSPPPLPPESNGKNKDRWTENFGALHIPVRNPPIRIGLFLKIPESSTGLYHFTSLTLPLQSWNFRVVWFDILFSSVDRFYSLCFYKQEVHLP